MTLDQVINGVPKDYYEPKSIQDINAKLKFGRTNIKNLATKAAKLGGIYVKDKMKFMEVIEVNPITKEKRTAEIRITDFITEKNIIRKPGMKYYFE